MNKESGSDAAIASSDTKNISSSAGSFTRPPAKKVRRRQAFREAWLKDPHFEAWLQQADDPLKAKCTVCSKFVSAKKSHLKEHAKADIHIVNIQQKAGASISVPSNAAVSSSGTENDSSSGSTFVVPAAMKPKAKTVHREQAFRKAWLKDPQFRLWLQETENRYRAKCTLCCKFIRARKSQLQQHARTDNHIMHIQQKEGASISVPSSAAISNSDAETDSSADRIFVVPAAKKVRRRTFRQAWLEDPHIKRWLQQADDTRKAKCTVGEARVLNMVHPKEGLTSTVKRAFADNVKVAEVTICIDATEQDRSFQSRCHFYPRQNGEDKRQCQVDEVPSTSSASEAASTRTRRNGETPTTTRRVHPIVHDHRYAKIPRSMWKKILVQEKQIQALKRLRHVDKQHIFRLKKQVTSLKRIVNKFRSTRALPDSGLEKNIKQKQQISKGSGNTI